jgi:hypothetical protein
VSDPVLVIREPVAVIRIVTPGPQGPPGEFDLSDLSADQIAFEPPDPFTATNVQTAIVEAQALGSAGGNPPADQVSLADVDDWYVADNVEDALAEAGVRDNSLSAQISGVATDLAAVAADLIAHLADALDAHDASAISLLDQLDLFTATDVEAALAEAAQSLITLQGAISDVADADAAALTAHENASDPHPGYQLESEKGQASGYAGLDAGGKVPDGQLPAALARDSEVTAAVAAEAALARNADNLTSGTVADARIPSTIARDSEVTSAVAAEATARDAAISAAVANLIASAPGALDTLNELAAAMGNDPNFATTVTNALALKADDSAVLHNTLYDANSLVIADTDDTPVVKPMGASTMLARLATGGIVAATPSQIRTLLGLVIGTDVQAQDAELSAIAGLTSVADRIIRFTGSGTATLDVLTSFARTLLDDPDASTARATLGLTIGTDVQAHDADLDAIAALTSAADVAPYATGAQAWSTYTLTAAARSLLDDADVATMRATLGLGSMATQAKSAVDITGGSVVGITDLAVADGGTGASTAANARTNLGLVIGTDVEAHDADLTAIAALVSAANKLPYATGAGAWALADFTAAGRALVDDADAAAQRTTLGLGTMATQAASAVAITGGTISGITGTDYLVLPLPGGYPTDDASGSSAARPEKIKSGAAATSNCAVVYYNQLLFDPSTDQHWLWQIVIPGNWTSGGTLRLKWGSKGTTNNVVWKASQASSTDSSTDMDTSSAFAAVALSAAVAVPGTVGQTKETAIALTTTGMAANALCVLMVGRDADNGSDNSTSDAVLLGVVFEYTGNTT